MPRVVGIDPGTVTLGFCGLDDGRVFLDQSVPTASALSDPSSVVALLEAAAPLDLIAGPSGYGLPFVHARDLTDDDLRLAYLAAEGEAGGIHGLRSLMRALARTSLPIVLTPGVVHLASVPAHRKVNRVDMGTADKVCAAVLAVHELAARDRCSAREVSFILLELGGAFTAAIAVENGRIVDGIGGTSGPLGIRSAGALDGEVAFLAGSVSKATLFTGGAATIAGEADPSALFTGRAAPIVGNADPSAAPTDRATVAGTSGAAAESPSASLGDRRRVAWEAFVEGAVKAVAALRVSAPRARDVVLSGRLARVDHVRGECAKRLAAIDGSWNVHVLTGFAAVAKQAAQGAALIADGLAGGPSSALIDAMGIRDARGTVLDHLYVIDCARAKARVGLKGEQP